MRITSRNSRPKVRPVRRSSSPARRDMGSQGDKRLFLQLASSALIVSMAVLVTMVGGGVQDGMIATLERTTNLSDINDTLQSSAASIPVIGKLFNGEETAVEVFGTLFSRDPTQEILYNADGSAAQGYISYPLELTPAIPMFAPEGAAEEEPFVSNFDAEAFASLPDLPDDNTDGGVTSAAVSRAESVSTYRSAEPALRTMRFVLLSAGKEAPPEPAEEMADSDVLPDNCTMERQALATELRIPVNGTITSVFGAREARTAGQQSFHHGLDIAAPTGTSIRPVAAGVVAETGYNAVYGNYLLLEHEGGLTSKYAHCDKLLVKQGDKVKTSTKVATVGSTGDSTGSHLHLELRLNMVFIDPALHLGLGS